MDIDDDAAEDEDDEAVVVVVVVVYNALAGILFGRRTCITYHCGSDCRA